MRKVGLKIFITLQEYFGVLAKSCKKIFSIEESNHGSIISPSLVDVSFV